MFINGINSTISEFLILHPAGTSFFETLWLSQYSSGHLKQDLNCTRKPCLSSQFNSRRGHNSTMKTAKYHKHRPNEANYHTKHVTHGKYTDQCGAIRLRLRRKSVVTEIWHVLLCVAVNVFCGCCLFRGRRANRGGDGPVVLWKVTINYRLTEWVIRAGIRPCPPGTKVN